MVTPSTPGEFVMEYMVPASKVGLVIGELLWDLPESYLFIIIMFNHCGAIYLISLNLEILSMDKGFFNFCIVMSCYQRGVFYLHPKLLLLHLFSELATEAFVLTLVTI